MRLRGTAIATALLALTFAIANGCSSSSSQDAARAVKVEDTTPPTGPVLLGAFDTGVGGIAAGAAAPLWLEPNAVAAADGTSVFAVRRDAHGGPDFLVGVDPDTGAETRSWSLGPSGLSVAAVAPKARWIALTDRKPGYGSQDHAATNVVVFDTSTGTPVHKLALTGDVQPEAFSTDGTLLFALNYLVDHYRVQTIELATGKRYDTSDRDKVLPPEDMRGHAVHGVMSKDRTLLATLYRNPGDDEEPAFVHVLDLQHGWSYCADLPAPFGTGAPGTDVIQLTRADTVVVAATPASRIAEIHIQDVRKPPVSETGAPNPVRVAYRNGNVDSPDAPFRSLPGFEYVITSPEA